ncbi:MAG: glycosyltransferase [Fimbriimonadaceae bacterium]|jgi:hypothetical protein|nr:glycosyltransferase [Fimbriimonadaceae bacterium]
MMRILYLGDKGGTSLHRAIALEDLGHDVHHIEQLPFRLGRLQNHFHYETGYLLYQNRYKTYVLNQIKDQKFDAIWVDSGKSAGQKLLRELRSHGPIILFNHDNPYVWRDRGSWLSLRRALPQYDAVVVVRSPDIELAQRLGVKRVIHEFRTADEVFHAPLELSPRDWEIFGSEVAFVGTWMEDRGAVAANLISLGVPLTIYGTRWQKAKEWKQLEPFWRSVDTSTPESYRKAIQCSKCSLCLLSKGNRDHHTTRSVEIPYLEQVLVAPRTNEHLEMYEEGKEAIFWSSLEECADQIKQLLSDPERRDAIAAAGKARALRDKHTNRAMLSRVLHQVVPGAPEPI